jgi:hypothetical protein
MLLVREISLSHSLSHELAGFLYVVFCFTARLHEISADGCSERFSDTCRYESWWGKIVYFARNYNPICVDWGNVWKLRIAPSAQGFKRSRNMCVVHTLSKLSTWMNTEGGFFCKETPFTVRPSLASLTNIKTAKIFILDQSLPGCCVAMFQAKMQVLEFLT